jgi:SAM-dependent MidA family methyltransferase
MALSPKPSFGILSDMRPDPLEVSSPQAHATPQWLSERLQAAGGSVPFRTYMDWALHDPDHGYYGGGRARIGPKGDFATSPSLGQEFAALLLPQLIDWLDALPGDQLSLVETGPGEGHLAGQLVEGLSQARPDLASRTQLVLLEPNPGMAALQQQALQGASLPIRWSDWQSLHRAPLRGVVIAHEVLDALPVDRVVWDGLDWRWQHVADQGRHLRLIPGPALTSEQLAAIPAFDPAEPVRAPGWCTEVHSAVGPWLQACGQALEEGVLLVIDYALEARRYFSPWRDNGTLMAYRRQLASADPLLEPGAWDLTAHLCLEGVEQAARAAGWTLLGERRQGEALLALGLAQRLSALSQMPSLDLNEALQRREQLLRLVDPLATGEFRWLVFERHRPGVASGPLTSRCLGEPPPMEGMERVG